MTFVLDAYAARSCPLKTVNAFTPHLVAPSLTRPNPPFFHDAEAVEAAVVARLVAGSATVADLRGWRGAPSAEAERACLDALASGVDVVLGGLLPRDVAAHRSGRPTMLVRAPGQARGYRPVQLKFHRVLETAGVDDEPQPASTLGDPQTAVGLIGRRFRWGQRLNAALQVAHHWRLLEASGFAADEPWAGLIGNDEVVVTDGRGAPEPVIVWLDLGAERCPQNPREVEFPHEAPPVTTLARYDAEHRYRVELAARALASSGQETLLTPILSPECRGCVWQEHCQSSLDADDLSLRISRAPLDVHEVRTLRRLGVSTVAELAEADLDALLADYLPRVSHRDGGEQRLRRAHHRARLINAGIELERQTEGALDLPRHDLEIDVDIETSADDRVYLWGFWVDDAAGGPPAYREFSAFAVLDDEAERALAAAALGWLREVTAGRDSAVYHYSDYEVIRVNKLASGLERGLAGWARAFAAERFVDLFGVVKRHFFGANGLGLKVVASAVTGFAWRDEDPGGLNSQSWFAEAVADEDATIRELARVRVLEYNEDDVRATWHLRRWLREQA